MPPRPKTATVEPGFDFGRVQHGADAGGDAATQQADFVQRRFRVDFGQRDFRQHGVFGKGRGAHVVIDGFAVLGKTADVPSGIRPWPWVARMVWQRLVLPTLQNAALAAFGGVQRNDVIAAA